MNQQPSWYQGIVRWFAKAWNFITTPSPEVREAGKRRQAQLLAALSILLAIASVGGILGSLAVRAELKFSFYVQLPLVIGSILAYAFSRSRHYRLGTWILALGVVSLGFADAAVSPTPVEAAIIYIIIAFLIVLGIFSWVEIGIFSLILMAACFLLPLFSANITPAIFGTILGQVLTYGLLSIGVIASRNAAERDRINEVVKTSEQLQQLSASLEQRVAERTRDIALAAEIGRRITMVRDLSSLLAQSVELIRDRFDLYYTQIYLADARGQALVVRAGTGRIGEEMLRRGHRLPVDLTSLNGTAALERRAVIVEDTTHSLIFRPHALLPETRSELAIPLIAGDRVLGVLDLQSSTPGALTSEDLPAFETLAGQLATALLNAELFDQTQHTLAEVEGRSQQAARHNWDRYLNAIDQKEHLGYVFNDGVTRPLVEPLAVDNNPHTLTASINVTGEPVGVLELEGDAPWDADTIELVNVVTAQLAQQVENLRLLDQSERYRDEMEVALRRATREEWQEYTSAPENKVLAYQYSGDEVTALENEANAGSEVTVPIKVQDEMIGQFGLQDIKTLSEEDQELVNVISEQLSAHLENMRLYSAAQREIAERQRLGDIITRQYEQTQASESLIRSVINATPDWIFIKDQQHRYQLVNQGYANSLHINLDDFIGKNDLELGFPEELVKGNPEKGIAGFWADDRRVMDSGETEIIPNDVVMIDGLLRTFNTIKTPLRDANGQVLGVLAFARDVTDREAVLADTEALYNVTSRLARSRSQKEVLDAVVEGTVMHNFDTASIYFFDQPWRENEKPKLLITEAFWERVPGSFPARLNMPLPVQAVPGIEKLVESPYIFIEDARTYADMPDLLRQMLVESKMLSVLNVRLIVGGEWVGTISATCEQPQVITEADVRRLLTLVDQAAAVFYGLLQYQSTQARARREQTLREITAHVRSSMDPEAILRTAVRELGNALGRQTFIRLGSPEQLMEKPAPGNGHAANGKNESTSLTGEGGK